MITESACGKIILFGEHAVVYGKPALAAPLKELRLFVDIEENDKLVIESKDFNNIEWIRQGITRIIEMLKVDDKFKMNVRSDIPIACGLGSSAALSVAATKAIAKLYGQELSLSEIRAVSFEAENVFHGKASGIDNTVITYEKPIYYIRGEETKFIDPVMQHTFLIIDSGKKSKTADVVREVMHRYNLNREKHQAIFDDIENTVNGARIALEQGMKEELGELLDHNQASLRLLGVSTTGINMLIQKVKDLEAHGAKICGAGKGGNIIALVDEEKAEDIKQELSKDWNVILTKV